MKLQRKETKKNLQRKKKKEKSADKKKCMCVEKKIMWHKESDRDRIDPVAFNHDSNCSGCPIFWLDFVLHYMYFYSIFFLYISFDFLLSFSSRKLDNPHYY